MDYRLIYDELTARGKNRAVNRKEAKKLFGYCEEHHVVPKCLGGNDEKENLVYLTAREHFLAHFLLIKIYPREHKLLLACNRLLYDKQGDKLNGKSYERLKQKISEYRKTQNKHNNEGIALGSLKRKGRTIQNYKPFAVMAEKQRGRTKHTHEGPRKISEKKKGQTKEKCEGTAIMAEKLKGRTKNSHLYLKKAGEKRRRLKEDVRIEIIKRRDEGETFSSIHEWVVKILKINVATSTISNLYYREKKSIANGSRA